MTITVVTLDHGKFEFPEADNWTVITDEGAEGILWVGKEEDGVGVAQFAKGSWSLVYETKDEPEKLEPRVWESRDGIPIDVAVRAAGGEVWRWYEEEGSWLWGLDGPRNPFIVVGTGPYTEVVE